MATKLVIPYDAKYEGIEIVWTPSTQRLFVTGWYDTLVGINGQSFTLREFFDKLHITEKDCVKAWRSEQKTEK